MRLPAAAAAQGGGQIDYLTSLELGSAALKGQSDYSDILQDFIGFRALLTRQDAYPLLGPAFKALGIEWNVPHASTHPPTSYLFTAPVALLPWQTASTLWAYAMVAALAVSLRWLGLSWKVSGALTPFLLFWPPASLSLGQLTIPWLFFTAAAYRMRRHPWGSGAAIGLAFSIKYFPGLLLVPFVFQRRWKVIAAFLAASAALVGAVCLLSPAAFARYLAVNPANTAYNINRFDNGAVFTTMLHTVGIPGLVFLGLFFGWIVYANRRTLGQDPTVHGDPWLLWTYFSVALLPISWNYALLPLLPLVIWSVRRRRLLPSLLCVVGVILSSCLPYGGIAPVWQGLSILCFGLALVPGGE